MPTERILLVDDDEATRVLLEYTFQRQGYTVRSASSQAEALAAFPDFAPHLVLLDYTLREGSGPATCLALRQRPGNERLPILFLTARAEAPYERTARAAGATDYLRKPLLPRDLCRIVARHLRSGPSGAVARRQSAQPMV